MKSSNFQIILIVVFIIGAVVAVLIFAGIIPVGQTGSTAVGNVVAWGTIPKNSLSGTLDEYNRTSKTFKVNYVQKNSATFDGDLVEALASGTGPDLILLPENLILRYTNKITVIPYTTFPQRTFQDTFVNEANLYLTDKGIIGFPVVIDPLVIYYNRNSFQSANISEPPKTWDDVASYIPKFTVRDTSGNITKSAISLGTFSNIPHAKDILSMFFLQAGNSIVVNHSGQYVSTLVDTTTLGNRTQASGALEFYTAFSNPLQSLYSWNKTLPNSLDAFTSGDSAMYIGFASEYQTIQKKNPNLSFDVARIPQAKNAETIVTFGKMTAASIMKSSKNPSGAYAAAQLLSGADFSLKIATDLNLPPPRRDLLAGKPLGTSLPVFYQSALVARSWLDPNPEKTDDIFKGMIENVTSGRLRASEAISSASANIDILLKP
ncbi:MAG: extracellular solute-binding protein [Candidatus Paceibacterota bacterium]